MNAFSLAHDHGVAIVTFNLPGEPVNKLSTPVLTEFDAVLEQLRGDAATQSIVIISGKPDNFVAGADIEEFTRLATAAEAEALSRAGQAMLDRVAAFPKPIVVAIHGACVGGGFELALACHYRIASDSPKTAIGLPEVQLGLLPGAGGCNRLPRLVGLRAALDMILVGKTERAAKAYKLGMVDELVPPSILRPVAIAAARRLAEGRKPKRAPKGGVLGALLDRTAPGRAIVYRQARKQVLQKTGGHYPAPLAAIEAVRVGLEQGMDAGLAYERRAFGELAVGEVSRKLVQIFFATTALKKDDGVPPDTPVHPPKITRVGVVGSGFMGSGIAGTAVLNAEVEVRLKDADLSRVGKGLKAAQGILDERLKRRRLDRTKYQRLVALLSGTADYSGFTRVDLVIEAVFEDLELKRRIIAELEEEAGAETLIASNTSTLPIGDIAAGAEHPERILGMHFFSPVEKMPLLEIIPHEGTSADAIVAAARFGRKLGKTVIVVADAPGFWVNRILSPYLNEAGLLIEQGVPIDLIDRTMTRFGFPVGPVALLDEVGLDVAVKAAKVMHEAFGDRLQPSSVVARMIAHSRFGRKNGRGFYAYHEGHKTGVDESVYSTLDVKPLEGFAPTTIEQRLVYAMLNEAAMAAHEGVIRSPRDGDIGAIFGIGFPPFRGGPLRMIDDLGAARVVEVLNLLTLECGVRFTPAPALVEMARLGERFYPAS